MNRRVFLFLKIINILLSIVLHSIFFLHFNLFHNSLLMTIVLEICYFI